jgi:carboxymethylenebutenolidase
MTASAAVAAGVAFYGPPVDAPNPVWPKSPTQLAPEMKAPVLGIFGKADTGIPVASVEAPAVPPGGTLCGYGC